MTLAEDNSGTLYIVATPIGNLGDISQRAIDTLRAVDVIACEDTRHSKKLLSAFSISGKTISLHDHNERQKQEYIGSLLASGSDVALVSDAGTPLISDPGFHLVRYCRQQGLNVSPVPGACAAISALSVAGLPTDRFAFEGFLPAKTGARQAILQGLANETRTMVFYDAPRRAIDTVQDIVTVLGESRYLVIARELTKTFETIYSNTAGEMLNWLSQDANQLKGEMVLIIEGAPEKISEITPEVERALKRLLKELPPKKACAVTADLYEVNKKALYDLTLSYK
ncbi:16S rRNA (cytidine(1402)-2'-O)-methyltransferase [Thalassotalea sp. 1_MG-2023]|uniref:16S rRNA (cytidine(1402)-2'-O)-methyltransferase n=1 Tax=Thalassotalea sp. 1_MG-2023 TaxID=3062680 RepID=UPI0026E1A9FB|nr:16S rRNA (cytidine(1402)-2'-O)-methyltransferase [Thalassotalea sp. 1_MG-2023]MDO6425856.1 16S rRNA (cytidine(1402)-2'-O)-methyltransferase [Thalassotalea sp. 1_MG-2023]